jgi:ABC-type thiamine transport system ATPase subunit
MTDLQIAKELALPRNAVTQTFGFIARKGAGKTYACGKLVELLHGAGARFIVLDIVGNWGPGLRLAADGKRQLEGCDVMVLDTVGGREAEGSTFSGGERVMIGEALSLALSMLACRRAGLERPTLVRDESGAALDPENARVYVAMLRRAAELVGADKVLFVSHDPEVQALADARIEVRP